MNTTKRIVAMVLCFVLVGWALYVSKYGVMSEENEFLSSTDKDSLVIWYTDDSLTDYINSACVSFNEKYGIRVVPRLQSTDKYLEAINSASVKDEGTPDLFLTTNDMLERAYLSGLAGEIKDNNNIVSNRYFPEAALNAVTYKGKLVAYPLYYETSALLYNASYLQEMAQNIVLAETTDSTFEIGGEVYNRDDSESMDEDAMAYRNMSQDEKIAYRIEEAIPDTFSELLDFANTCDAPQNVEAIFKWDVKDIFYNYFFVGNYINVGGPSGDDTEQIDIYNINTINSLTLYQDMNQFFSFDYEDITYESVLNEFLEGKLVFTTATSDAIRRIELAKEEGTFEYEYGTSTIPDINQFLSSRSMSVTDVVSVNGYSDKKESANEFARYLTVDYAINLYDMTGKLAACTNVNYDNEAISAFIEEYSDSVPVPKMMAASNYWLQAELAFANIWSGKQVSKELQALSQQIKQQVTGLEIEEDYIEMPQEEQEETEYYDEEQLKQEAKDEDQEEQEENE